MNILLGITGSVAAILTRQVIEKLREAEYRVKAVATPSALYFCGPLLKVNAALETDGARKLFRDEDEWPHKKQGEWRAEWESPKPTGYVKGEPILHIELRTWADLLLIAPLSANTLAKISQGMADNLLTSIIRAWDRHKPIIVAPAMNTHMWEHPATSEQLIKIRSWYPRLSFVMPTEKTLACGDVGIGAMAEIPDIIRQVHRVLKEPVCAL